MIIQLLCLIFSRVFDLKAIWACWALYIYIWFYFIYLSIDLFIYLPIDLLVGMFNYLFIYTPMESFPLMVPVSRGTGRRPVLFLRLSRVYDSRSMAEN